MRRNFFECFFFSLLLAMLLAGCPDSSEASAKKKIVKQTVPVVAPTPPPEPVPAPQPAVVPQDVDRQKIDCAVMSKALETIVRITTVVKTQYLDELTYTAQQGQPIQISRSCYLVKDST